MPVKGYFSNSRWKRKRILLQFFRKGLVEFGYIINESATIVLRCRISLGCF